MKVKVIRTRKLRPPQGDLYAAIKEAVREVAEESILVVASKVVAIHQGRVIKIEKGVDREILAKREAQWYFDRDLVPGEHLLFTIKDNTLIASSGIDKSNSEGYFVLWPKDPMKAAREIHGWVKRKYRVNTCGVIIVDSHVTPMRRGVMGISLGHWGFNPVRDYVGKPDIFGKSLKVTVTNVVDGLAAAAVVEMGEGKEQTPLALITDTVEVEFSEDEKVIKGNPSVKITMKEDLFRPMLEGIRWKKGGSPRVRS